jgi:hypothetical protein
MEKIKCPACYTELGERNETDLMPNTNADVSIEEGMIYFHCRNCGNHLTMAKSSDIEFLAKPGIRRA